MRELKINNELKNFIPPLSGEEKDKLEKSLLKFGYKGGPIYIWNDYIVDGHNRYELCQKHKIEYDVEELDLGTDSTIIDVMEWMINTQLGRRNLPAAQRLAVVEKFKKKIQEEAKENQSLGGGDQKSESAKNRVSPIGEKRSVTHTDKELAKLAGVGSGTVARYNRVMNSDDEELKNEVKSGKVSINAGYEKIRNKEKINIEQNSTLTTPIVNQPKNYQEASKMFGGIQQGHLPNRKKENFNDGFTDEQLVNALISSKTPENVFDAIVPKQEFDIMSTTLLENIKSCDYRIFDLHEVHKKMNALDIEYAIEKFDEVIELLIKLKEKIRNIEC